MKATANIDFENGDQLKVILKEVQDVERLEAAIKALFNQPLPYATENKFEDQAEVPAQPIADWVSERLFRKKVGKLYFHVERCMRDIGNNRAVISYKSLETSPISEFFLDEEDMIDLKNGVCKYEIEWKLKEPFEDRAEIVEDYAYFCDWIKDKWFCRINEENEKKTRYVKLKPYSSTLGQRFMVIGYDAVAPLSLDFLKEIKYGVSTVWGFIQEEAYLQMPDEVWLPLIEITNGAPNGWFSYKGLFYGRARFEGYDTTIDLGLEILPKLKAGLLEYQFRYITW